ncbi:MAG: hydroxyethylthiazole kinase-like uncharacterized protein yjeF [Myxococcota bacterium]|jgi:hydroxyethylthiazole kinase-like uncharacterized protein yjeF
MIPVSDAATVRARDLALINTLGIPGHTQMELAAHGAARLIHATLPAAAPTAILCGPGNNGGDGYVVARWLHALGHPVRLWAPLPPRGPDATKNADLCRALSIPILPTAAAALDGAACAIDALLGTGQRDAPRGILADGVHALAAARAAGVMIHALDIPTGLCADTGQILGTDHVTADHTYTFGDHKQGLFCEPAASLSGLVTRIDLGLDLTAGIEGTPQPGAGLLEVADIAARMPVRGDAEAKWHRGHVAIRASGGAGVLAAHGAFCAGAGLVTLLVPRADWAGLRGLWPEVILAEPDALDPRRHDVLIIGPGLGLGGDCEAEVTERWARWPGALLADADALSILARVPQPPATGSRIITPHSAEAARLLGKTRAEVEADRFRAATALGMRGVSVLKGPNTIVSTAGQQHAVVPVRCGRLATAGSGDVLAGLIGGLLAQGCLARDAAIVGSWWHAHAGLQMPRRGTAGDLLRAIRATAPDGLAEFSPLSGEC